MFNQVEVEAYQKMKAMQIDRDKFKRDRDALLVAAKAALIAGELEIKLGNKAWEHVVTPLRQAIKQAEGE
jgi:hypothetical protein